MVTGLQCRYLSTAQIVVLRQIWKTLGLELNKWENHVTNSNFANSFAWKMFLFEFCNSFNAYFYIAFFKARFEGCLVYTIGEGTRVALTPEEMGWGDSDTGDTDGKQCLDELKLQLQLTMVILAITNVVRGSSDG